LTHFGQYQGAGVFTGFGLRFRHLAQWNRLPFTAVFGRVFFPLLGKFFAIGTSLSVWPKNPWTFGLGSNKPIHQDMVSILPGPQLYLAGLPPFLDEPESFVEPDRVHVAGQDRQPDLFDQRVGFGPGDQGLEHRHADPLAPPVFADGDGEDAAMGNTTTRTILESQAADHRPRNLGQDDELAGAVEMVLNPLPLLLGSVELVGLQPEERGFREDVANERDQLGRVVRLGRADCDRLAGWGGDGRG
jgi:hypothetical protein